MVKLFIVVISGDYVSGIQYGMGFVEVEDSGSAYSGEVIESFDNSYERGDDEGQVWGTIAYDSGITYEGFCIECARDGYVS